MKPSHIAFVTLQSNAHVYPILGLCSELAKRGHHVTVPTNARYEREVREAGAEPVMFNPVRVENAVSFLRASSFYDQHFWTMWASLIGPRLLINAASAFPQLEKYYTENQPDLILDDRFSFLGRMLAARFECPVGQFSPHFAPYMNSFVRENGTFSNPAPILAFSSVLDFFLQAYGIKTDDNLWRPSDLNIYFIPREFQMHSESFDERFCFVGPCLNRPVLSEWKNRSAGKPIVLVSGSQADDGMTYFRAMIDAFAGSELHIILSPGASIPDDAFGPLPNHFEINRDAFNFQILPHTRLTISQGGTGTVMESLYFGVPLLVVPRMPVHAETAYRVAELRLGSYLPEQSMSAAAIGESVAQLLNDTALVGRVACMQQIVRGSGGAEMAANHIEHFLH